MTDEESQISPVLSGKNASDVGIDQPWEQDNQAWWDWYVTLADNVAEDGDVRCLARLHDKIAGQMKEWTIAAAFAEKMARRFSHENKPKAA